MSNKVKKVIALVKSIERREKNIQRLKDRMNGHGSKTHQDGAYTDKAIAEQMVNIEQKVRSGRSLTRGDIVPLARLLNAKQITDGAIENNEINIRFDMRQLEGLVGKDDAVPDTMVLSPSDIGSIDEVTS